MDPAGFAQRVLGDLAGIGIRAQAEVRQVDPATADVWFEHEPAPAVGVSIATGQPSVRIVWASYTFDAVPVELAGHLVTQLFSGAVDLRRMGRVLPRYVMTVDIDGNEFSASRSDSADMEEWELALAAGG